MIRTGDLTLVLATVSTQEFAVDIKTVMLSYDQDHSKLIE